MNWEVARQSDQNDVYPPKNRQGKNIASAQARRIEGPLKDWIDKVFVPAMLPIYLAAEGAAAEDSVRPVMESVQ